MPNERLSPRQRKLLEMSQMQQMQQGQQQAAQASQAQMMQQLAQMYEMQQNEQFAPERLRALEQSNQAQSLANEKARFDQQWAQPNAELAYRGGSAQATRLEQDNAGTLTPGDMLRYYQSMGIEPPPEFDVYLPPEMRAVREKAKAQKEAERQAAIAKDAAEQNAAAPAFQPRTANELGNEAGNAMRSLYVDPLLDTPAAIVNSAGSAYDFLNGLFGTNATAPRLVPLSKIREARARGTDYERYFNPASVKPEPLPVARR